MTGKVALQTKAQKVNVSDKYKSATIKTTKNKKYYYKVRAYKTTKVNGKNVTVYAPWSSVKSYTLK